jgi:hypothetical protein
VSPYLGAGVILARGSADGRRYADERAYEYEHGDKIGPHEFEVTVIADL